MTKGAKGAVKAGKRLSHELATNDRFRNTLAGAVGLPAGIGASLMADPESPGKSR